MAGKIRHMINRSGRYHARLVIPKDLRHILGKTELRTPLGGDYRTALRMLPGAVAGLQHQIATAEREAGQGGYAAPRYPLAPDQIALSLYSQRLAMDDKLRLGLPGYGVLGINDALIEPLRAGIAGRTTDQELVDLVGKQIESFQIARQPRCTTRHYRMARGRARYMHRRTGSVSSNDGTL